MRCAWLSLVLLVACTEHHEAIPLQVVQPSPQVIEHDVKGNAALVMQLTTVDDLGLAHKQRCFVWRDAEYRTAALSCPADPIYPELAP